MIAGHDRDEVTALIFPDVNQCGQLQSASGTRATFEALLKTFAGTSAGSSTRVERAILLDEPPSLDEGELTDKGTVNQRAILRRRADLVEMLYRKPYAASVILMARS